MKAFLLLALLLCSSLSYASNAWVCMPLTREGIEALPKLNFSAGFYDPATQLLTVNQELYCDEGTDAGVDDYCYFEHTELFVDDGFGVLETTKGHRIPLFCQEMAIGVGDGGVGGSN